MNKLNYGFSMSKKLFLDYLKRNCYSSETIKGYEKDLQFFNRFMELEKGKKDFSLEEVTKDTLLELMDYGRIKGHKTNTIARRLSTLKSFYKFLIYEQDFPYDVAARIKVPKVYIPLINILSESEITLLLRKAGEISFSYQLFFSVLYYTGSRLTPVRMLKKSDINLKEKILYFPKVKGGKDLYLPLHDHLCNLFEQYFSISHSGNSKYVFPSKRIPGKPISASDIRNKLRLAAKKAGIQKTITPHTLRHCMATHLTIKRVDQRTIASILGHADLRSTMRYQHLSVDHLREPLNSL